MKRVRKRIIAISSVVMIMIFLSACARSEKQKYSTLEDLNAAVFAISNGNVGYLSQIKEDLPNAKIKTYTGYFDTFMEVENGRCDAAFCFKYCFIPVKETYDALEYISSGHEVPIVVNFSKSEKANTLKKQLNEFIAEYNNTAEYRELVARNFVDYNELTVEDLLDYSNLTGENGSFILAYDITNKPYEYLIEHSVAGFEVEYIYAFCKAYGYKPQIINVAYDSVVDGIASGKYDMAIGGYGYTEERAESSNFSDPILYDEIVYVVMGDDSSAARLGLVDRIYNSTIKDNRWKIIVNGLLNTLIITAMSVLLGSLLGFLLFVVGYRRKLFERNVNRINDFFESIPVLVVIMLFFYVIFGKSTISGSVVSIIVFGMLYTFTFHAMISGSVKMIPKDQTEAGLSLGYSDNQVLFKILIPQALDGFLPNYKSSIIGLLKATSIVGYVAVEDLTKASDIIRSQTFDAFIPITIAAVFYFIIARFIIALFEYVIVSPAGKIRKKERENS